MSETTHANGDLHGTHGAGAPHAVHGGDVSHDDATHGAGAHADDAHGTALGPVDWPAWGAGLLGVAAGLVVAACLFLSTNL